MGLIGFLESAGEMACKRESQCLHAKCRNLTYKRDLALPLFKVTLLYFIFTAWMPAQKKGF